MDPEKKEPEAPKAVALETYRELEAKNRQLSSDLAALTKKFEGVDLDALQAAKNERDALKRKAAEGDEKKIDELVKAREAEVRGEVGKQIEALTKQVNELTGRNKELEVTDKVFAMGAGRFVEHAHSDFKDYIRRFCDLQDGQIVVKDEKGQIRYVNGNKPMSAEEFIGWVAESRPHWAVSQTVAGMKQGGQKVVNGGTKFTLQDLQGMPPEKQREVLAAMPMEQAIALARGIRF